MLLYSPTYVEFAALHLLNGPASILLAEMPNDGEASLVHWVAIQVVGHVDHQTLLSVRVRKELVVAVADIEVSFYGFVQPILLRGRTRGRYRKCR